MRVCTSLTAAPGMGSPHVTWFASPCCTKTETVPWDGANSPLLCPILTRMSQVAVAHFRNFKLTALHSRMPRICDTLNQYHLSLPPPHTYGILPVPIFPLSYPMASPTVLHYNLYPLSVSPPALKYFPSTPPHKCNGFLW